MYMPYYDYLGKDFAFYQDHGYIIRFVSPIGLVLPTVDDYNAVKASAGVGCTNTAWCVQYNVHSYTRVYACYSWRLITRVITGYPTKKVYAYNG